MQAKAKPRPSHHLAKSGAAGLFEKMKAGAGLDRRTKAGRLYVQVQDALLVHVAETTGAPPSLVVSLVVQQVAQLAVLCSLWWEWSLRHEAQGDALPMDSLTERFFTCVSRLDRALNTLAKSVNVKPGQLKDSFGDQLAALRVAVPLGSAEAQATTKPKRGKREQGK